jgi:hypothetical protein
MLARVVGFFLQARNDSVIAAAIVLPRPVDLSILCAPLVDPVAPKTKILLEKNKDFTGEEGQGFSSPAYRNLGVFHC